MNCSLEMLDQIIFSGMGWVLDDSVSDSGNSSVIGPRI
jgi:hypothetical protein